MHTVARLDQYRVAFFEKPLDLFDTAVYGVEVYRAFAEALGGSLAQLADRDQKVDAFFLCVRADLFVQRKLVCPKIATVLPVKFDRVFSPALVEVGFAL